ncbi:MAG: proton-conducting transporter membrane subunit [Haloferacaceae archaeon]
MSERLVALVAVPLAAAVVPPLAGLVRERSGWPVATVAMAVHAALAWLLVARVAAAGRVTYVVGGVPASVGIELVADGLSAPFVALVSLGSFALLAYARVGGPRSNPFYALYLLLVAGLTGLCLTGDVFNLYVFLEISGLAAYALVARASGGPAALAALKYLLVGTVGATFYLLGVGYVYVATGTLNMADVATHLAATGYDSPLVVAAFALILVGLGVKVALVPLHTWLPSAHSEAPVTVSVLLSGLVTSVAAYAVLRVALTVFTPAFFRTVALADDALLLAAAASVLYGGYAATKATKVKRVLAYSTVAQLGLATLGIGLLGATALTGAVVHLLGHGVMKGGLFLAAGCLSARYGATTVEGYAGLARRDPLVAAAFAVQALGMIGVPPTVGVLGKWYVALGAVEAGAWHVAALVFVSTLLSLSIFGPILSRLYFAPPASPDSPPKGRASAGMRAAAVGAAVATLAMGFGATYLGDLLLPALPGGI